MFDNLTDENYLLFAMKFYTNPNCTDLLEFQDDMKRIRYIKRLFRKYEQSGVLKERLILNHMIVIYNMFESKAATRMLFLKLDGYLHYLKPFLIMLNYWPTDIGLVNGERVQDSQIALDRHIVEILREI
jgi:hypothetical protein|tara:strand:+ start:120 stop:506 length:387 start_codon:yes stop_codon:yes gene_type:complete